MKEQDLIDLGFERVDVTAEESGYATDWYYYTMDFGTHRGISLISCDNSEGIDKGWYVDILEDESISFNKYEDVLDFITIIRKGINK